MSIAVHHCVAIAFLGFLAVKTNASIFEPSSFRHVLKSVSVLIADTLTHHVIIGKVLKQ